MIFFTYHQERLRQKICLLGIDHNGAYNLALAEAKTLVMHCLT